jgi:hypothetical protein
MVVEARLGVLAFLDMGGAQRQRTNVQVRTQHLVMPYKRRSGDRLSLASAHGRVLRGTGPIRPDTVTRAS